MYNLSSIILLKSMHTEKWVRVYGVEVVTKDDVTKDLHRVSHTIRETELIPFIEENFTTGTIAIASVPDPEDLSNLGQYIVISKEEAGVNWVMCTDTGDTQLVYMTPQRLEALAATIYNKSHKV